MNIIRLPEKLQTATEFVVTKWFKKAGETVKKGDILCVIQDAAQSLEIESPVDGHLLDALTETGSIVSADSPLLIIGQKGEDVSIAIDKLQSQNQPSLGISPVSEGSESVYADKSEKDASKEPAGERKLPPKPVESTVNGGEVITILMPQAGQSMEEGTILEWKVAPGDRIEAGQVIFEIETDKATMEVEAADSGRLARIVAEAGTIVEIKEPVAYLAENDADVDAFLAGQSTDVVSAKTAETHRPDQTEAKAIESQGSVQGQAVTQTGRVKASPAARKIAAQKGIDIGSVSTASGPGGRIISTDVLNAKQRASQKKTVQLSKMRRAIARNLQYSKQNIPHFYIKATVNAKSLFEVYQQTKKLFKCTVNDFVTIACAKAISQYPAFRGQYHDEEIIELPSVNIGIAVGTDEGLTVPVLVDADKMSLKDISQRSRELIENARNGKLEGIGQGIFTITNLGMFAVEEFSAIINPPESAILAVGAIREDILVTNGIAQPTRLMSLCLSVDHRVIDGVLAAKFIGTLKEILESPEQLLQ